MTTPNRLMAAGVPAGAAVQLGMQSKSGIVGTGGTKATAVQLIAGVNTLATVASAGVAAFILPTAEASCEIVVDNQGASSALVFANGTTETINALSAGASFSVTNAKRAVFYSRTLTTLTPPTIGWSVILSA